MRATGRQLQSQPNNTEGGVVSWGGAPFSASPRSFHQVFSSPRLAAALGFMHPEQI